MTDKIVVDNLYKVFGPDPEEGMRLTEQGLDKDTIFERTGNTVGVKAASFGIREGEIFVIMGLSGSGKSTMVRMLNRLIEPTAGRVLIDERDVTAMSQKELIDLRRNEMSMVFQSFALMPHRTVLQNAAFGLEVAGVEREKREERAMRALEQVGLKANANSYPDELSGGMQQRVGLARALAADPSIMLMDEAFSALDPLIRTEMQDELVALQREHRRTIVFISHDLDEAMRIGDRIAIMQGGEVVQVGTPEEIVSKPANDYVRSFFYGVDVTQVFTASDIADKRQVTVFERPGVSVRSAVERLQANGRDIAVVLDRDHRYLGLVTAETLGRQLKDGGEPTYSKAFVDGLEPVTADTPLNDVVSRSANTPYPLPVVDGDGHYLGTISKTTVLKALDRSGEQ
ncbi:glycine betaine/L-proline ABC transporter ATP-binding protein ProV [Sediminicurvatus halobius]|uniref:Quaternary amine transport ATP-binding protein n=1 Tax=Sediminicurvatus halobius TaxID=2182432 RepID=A0A2U2MWF0_9GAMM|nr:glycine betaine/L-proline ABC transporter ATP-binding protein ProV [Spiribacter halobius]PWG61174.1 proline/glycine betaine ABC transporter ATP-binding protein ProV [Spiribacter halobius]UEX78995.1 glycine betaine/L-proline ABC transporter ATP-binding protein ProV [Spiribacter halobius]